MTPAEIDEAHLAARHATRLSVGAALFLIALKAYGVSASGSVSLYASLADSALDLIASLGVFFAVRWAARPADAGHQHGHGKGEALAALVQSGLIGASAVFIGWEAVARMVSPRPVEAGGVGVAVMVVAMLVTAALVWEQGRAIARSGSMAVKADRAHYVADLTANAVVLIGVISGAWLDAPGLDAAAGLIVAVWLAWGATSLLRAAAHNLLDEAAPDADRVAITSAVLADARISGVHQLRTRMSGPVLMVQMHVDLDPRLTLLQAHDIVVEAERRIQALYPRADILIHPDPRGVVDDPETENAREGS